MKRRSESAAEMAAMSGKSITQIPGARHGLCNPGGSFPHDFPETGSPLFGIMRGYARCYQRTTMGQAIRILGIDPGLRRTGWGLIACEGNRLIYLACGSVETNERLALAERLGTIHDGLGRVVDEFRPDEAAAEATFVNRDATRTLERGQARRTAL